MTDEFKVLNDRDYVLKRFQIWGGSTTMEDAQGIVNYQFQSKNIVPGLIKIIEEIFQNSITEHVKTDGEYATKIDMTITDTLDGTEITVTDNGRGIPIDMIGSEPRPVVAWTSLRAGTNFDDTNRKAASANGVGSVLTNIMSKSFIGATCDGTQKLILTCSDNMANISHKITKGTVRGTSVKFIPDLERFNLTEFTQDHSDILYDRFCNLAILYPKIQFSFNGEKIQFKNIKAIAKKFHEDSVSLETSDISLIFAPSGEDEEFRCLSYVNGLYIKNGGSHVDFVMGKIIEVLRQQIKKKHKIEVLPNQIRQHLLFASWIRDFNNLKFDSQSKERVTNSVAEISEKLGEIDFEAIAKKIVATPSILDPMVAAILYKKEMAEAQALKKKQKSIAKTRVVNHIAATDPNPENRMLFVVEGLSAMGLGIAVRNSVTQGLYPLRGKVLNVRGMKPLEILKNKEIFELTSILGLEFGKPATEVNYGKIVVMTDSDQDGAAINGLLLNLFSNWPELFGQGRIYRAMTPLYLCKKGKRTEKFYFKEDFTKFDSTGWEVSYLKGLGTMSEELYGECMLDPYLIKMSANDLDLIKLEMAFGDSADKRKEWMIG